MRRQKISKYIASALMCILFIFAILKVLFLNKNYDVTVVGPMVYGDGIGRLSIDAIKLFDSNGLSTNYIRTGSYTLKDVPLKVKLISKFTNSKPGKVVLFEDVLPISIFAEKAAYNALFPKKFSTSLNRIPRESQIYISYSMLESTKILSKWARFLNNYFDSVVVPSAHLVDIYKDSGVRIPVFYVPLGMNIDNQISMSLRKSRNKIFTFGTFSSLLPRKNQLTLIKAFVKVYKNRPDVRLIINARNGDNDFIEEIDNYLELNEIHNIMLNIGPLLQNEYDEMIKTIDCFVYISKGEGFAIQPREAMAMGIPVIISDNTAQHDIAESGLVRVVKSDIKEPAYYWFSKKRPVGYNFNVRIDDVADALIDVHDHYNKYLDNSEKAREWVKQFQYSNLKELYINMVKPKKVIFGNDNIISKDYLMTNDTKLYKKYLKLIKDSD
jgi:glycosyltransferase involved in cell wall biosynthesis